MSANVPTTEHAAIGPSVTVSATTHPETRLSGDVPVLIQRQTAQAGVGKGLHAHPEGQFYFAIQGLIAIETAAGRIVMPPGRAGWIPPGVTHGARVIGGVQGFADGEQVGFTMYLAPERCTAFPAVPIVLGVSDLVADMLGRMSRWPTGRPLSDREQRFLQVFLDELTSAPPELLRLTLPANAGLARIAAAMAEDLAGEISLDDWADTIGMSRRTITRRFRAETGLSIVEWRQIARMQRALELLGEGESVTSVSLTLGYDSVSSFIAIFKRLLGVTPGRLNAAGGAA